MHIETFLIELCFDLLFLGGRKALLFFIHSFGLLSQLTLKTLIVSLLLLGKSNFHVVLFLQLEVLFELGFGHSFDRLLDLAVSLCDQRLQLPVHL